MTSVHIPSSLTLLENTAFAAVYTLEKVTFGPNSGIKSLTYNTFIASKIKSFEIPPNVSYFQALVFNEIYTMESITVDPNNPNFYSNGVALFSSLKITLLYVVSSLTNDEFIVPETVSIIATACFVNSHIKKIMIQNPKTTINDYAFGASFINSIEIPDSVTNFGPSVFSKAINLKQIKLPSSITVITKLMFAHSGLTNISIPDGVYRIEDEAFKNCTDLVEIYMPSNLTELGGGVIDLSRKARYVFTYNSGIYLLNDEILIDNANTTISQYFGNKETVKIPETVVRIKKSAFKSKTSLITLECDGNSQLQYIESYAFQGCTNLKTIFSFPLIVSIESYAFQFTSINQPITFGKSLSFVGGWAYSRCLSLPSVTFTSSVELSIDENAFYQCTKLSFLLFDCSNSTSLGLNCFNGLSSLERLHIPLKITSVVIGCFQFCGLKSITFESNFFTQGSIPEGMFRNCSSLSDITLPTNIISIGGQAFMNTNISSVVIPDSLETLDRQCFKGCSFLSEVEITSRSVLREISYGVFDGCIRFSKLSEFASVNFVSNYGALYNKEQTKMYVYPPASPSSFFSLSYSVKYIADSAFIGCINLRSVMIPDNSVVSIGNNAFEGCINLRSINIPKCVKFIGDNAFLGCKNLICGSVIYEDNSIAFRNKLVKSGLSIKSLSECHAKTCKSTYYSMNYYPLFVFILI